MQIRQEINCVNQQLAIGALNALDSSEIVQLDTTQYNGTVTYYFEVEITGTNNTVNITLRRKGTATDDATVSFTSSDSSTTLRRSSSFTPPSGSTEYILHSSNSAASGNVKSARIIIIQNATTLSNTETQIEIGNKATTTSTTSVATTNPKYWQYTSANWDGTLTTYFEATIACASSKSATTAVLQTSTSITAPSWSDVASSTITTTSTTAARVRSGAITLTDGNWYRVAYKSGTSKSAASIYNAKIIIDQEDGSNISGARIGDAFIKGGTAGAGQTTQAQAQGFTIQATSTITGVVLRLKKVGSPTDTLNVDIVSSVGGSSLANATLSVSSLTTSYANYTLTFGSPVSLTAATKYYIQLTRNPDTNDGTNYISADIWDPNGGSGDYTEGGPKTRDNNVWSSEATTNDLYFSLIGQGGITKLEPQYLLANTLFAAGTGLQTFLTKWDSTEWDAGGGSITYKFQAEAADNSTSDVTLEQADGGGTVTNSTLTNIDNAQISAAMTMPGNENLDTKANGNAGDVAGARILVQYAWAAAAASFIAQKPYIVKQAVNRSNTY